MSNTRDHYKEEINTMLRVSDMMVSMHSTLRDRYTLRSTVLDCMLFASSIVIVALVWVDPELLEWLPGSIESSKFLIGGFALVTFFLTLLSFRLDWKTKAHLHQNAAQAYSQMKLECRHVLGAFNTTTEADIQRCLATYTDLGRICTPIPENQFLQLKKKHKMKVVLSGYLDDNPQACIRLVELDLCIRQIFRNLKNGWRRRSVKAHKSSPDETCMRKTTE